MNNERRHSSLHGKTSLKQIQQISNRFTQPYFLTKHSLFSNLYSSEPLSLSSPQKQFIKLFFGKQAISPPQIYEFIYFHRRDKKVMIYELLICLLQNDNKTEVIILQNVQKINKDDIRSFIKKFSSNQKLVNQFNKRVHFHFSQTNVNLKFNLQFLHLFQKKNQFAKCLIISDINTFEYGDKANMEKLYKRIPKDFLTIAFKKDMYDYKFVEKPVQDAINSNYTLNQKVINILNSKILDNLHHAYVIPIESIGITNSNIEDTFQSIILRKDCNNDMYEFRFKSYPYKLQAYRKIG